MTRQELKQYRNLGRECTYLQTELKALSTQNPATTPAADEKYQQMLQQRQNRCVDQLKQLESFVSSVPDSLARLLLSMRYQKGYSWTKIALLIGECDESYPRKYCNRYLDIPAPTKKAL